MIFLNLLQYHKIHEFYYLQVALLDEAPLGDIGMLMPIMVATMTPIPLFIACIFYKFCKRKVDESDSGLQDTELPNTTRLVSN